MNNWIVADPEHLGGSPRVRGTRISTEEAVRGALAELAQRKDLQPA
jgi:uncharacterized protein (DUF433 family)